MPSPDFQQSYTITMLSVAVGGTLLPVLFNRLSPGPKGTIRLERSEVWTGITLEQAWERLIDRLAQERFQITNQVEHQCLSAARPRDLAREELWAVRTHARSALLVEICLEALPSGVAVRAAVWNVSRISCDTGETAHMSQVLQRLLHAGELMPDLPPVPDRSSRAVVSLSTSAMLWLWLAIIASGLLSLSGAMGVILGTGIGLIPALVFGFTGLAETRRYPHKVRGTWIAVMAILLALGAFALTPTALYHAYGPADKTPGGAWAFFCEHTHGERGR